MALHEAKIKELEIEANRIRETIIEMLVKAGSGHTAGPLGMADILVYLYFYGLRHNPKKPDWPERDRLVLSNGHICPVLYATMSAVGYFPKYWLDSLRKFGSHLQGHPHRDFLPELETSSGPLGSGLSQTVGMALADKVDCFQGRTLGYGKGSNFNKFFYCLTSDGEHDEGNTWEAVLLAGKERLGNLIEIMDRNNIQIDGYTEDVMPLESLVKKYEAWNWHVQEIDGHNFNAIDDAVNRAKAVFDQPSVIIARTIPGKGVPAFERKYEWHGKPPTPKEGEMALAVLRKVGEELKR